MWCRHCQQDVPAARDHSGPAACSRCQREFVALPAGSRPALKLAAIADCGVELEEFDHAARQTASRVRPKLAGGEEDLRRLERLLRPQMRSDLGHQLPLLREPAEPPAVSDGGAQFELLHRVGSLTPPEGCAAAEAQRPRSAWGVKLLLILGALTFASGAGLLVAANLLLFELAWRWGFALTIAGEGLLIGALAGLAVRLWRNSRRMNSQLETIDRRLGDVQASVGVVGGAAISPANSLWRVDASATLGRGDLGVLTVR